MPTRPRALLFVLTASLVIAAVSAACGGRQEEPSNVVKDAFSGGASAATPGAASQALAARGNLASDSASSAPGVAVPSTVEKSLAYNGGAGGVGGLPGTSADFARKVIVNANISLNVKDVPAAFAEANRLARGAGGYVERSSFINLNDNKDDPQRTASITLRVPAAQYESTLASLRGIEGAKVRSEGSKSSEVTEQYTDLQSRLRNLERSEGQYLTLLAQAKTIAEIIQINDRLDSVRGQIEQIQGRLKVLDQLVDLATIDLALAPFPVGNGASAGDNNLGDVFATAWDHSLDAARYLAAGAIYAGVAFIWLALPAGLALLIYRRVVRKGTPPTAAA